MAYAMTYARHEDMRVIREYVSDADFREALDRAPPGIIDPRSWAYWNSKMGRYPPPPLPKRHFGDDEARCGESELYLLFLACRLCVGMTHPERQGILVPLYLSGKS
jgi:hypothetical protein